jgi:DNA-binding NarL/FixJ family response regulator
MVTPTHHIACRKNLEFNERTIELINGRCKINWITMARNYEAAEAIFDNEKPDMILLDIHLPGKNGIEVLKYIRRTGKFCWVMMIANQADGYYRRLCKIRRRLFFWQEHEFSMIPETIRTLAKQI